MIAGGKCANGAITAAFANMYNKWGRVAQWASRTRFGGPILKRLNAFFNCLNHGLCGSKAIERIYNIPGLGNLDLTSKGVDKFLSQNASRFGTKLGNKIGEGRLPFEKSREGFDKAISVIEKTLRNVAYVSGAFTTRGGHTTIDIFSKTTNFTVRIRSNGTFDTLIHGATNKVRVPPRVPLSR